MRLAEALQTVAVLLTDQNLAQSRVLIPAPAYRLPEIAPRLRAEPPQAADAAAHYQRYAVTASGVSPMAIPGTPSCAYVADGLAAHRAWQAVVGRRRPPGPAGQALAQDHRLRLWRWVGGRPRLGRHAILTWGSSTAAAREAAERLRARDREVKVIGIRLLLPASPGKLTDALSGVTRVLVVEQSHGRQFHQYLRAHYDIAAVTRVLARPGPLPITPGEIVEQIENWS